MRIGLLGTGRWAQVTWAPALAAHEGVEFAGVWGRRPEAARELAEAHGVRVYASPEELIADCDAVACALPPDVQAEHALAAARGGRHLLLDKPLATDPKLAREVADAAEAAGVASAVFFTLRFSEPGAGWLREQAGRGGWFVARAEWIAALYPLGGEPSTGVESPWRREKGALWDVGPHALSVLETVLGEARLLAAVRGQHDLVHLTLGHAGGATSTATLGLTAPPGVDSVGALFLGEHGAAELPGRGESAADALGRTIDTLLAAAAGETDPGAGLLPCDVRYAQHVTELLAEAERALDAAPR